MACVIPFPLQTKARTPKSEYAWLEEAARQFCEAELLKDEAAERINRQVDAARIDQLVSLLRRIDRKLSRSTATKGATS